MFYGLFLKRLLNQLVAHKHGSPSSCFLSQFPSFISLGGCGGRFGRLSHCFARRLSFPSLSPLNFLPSFLISLSFPFVLVHRNRRFNYGFEVGSAENTLPPCKRTSRETSLDPQNTSTKHVDKTRRQNSPRIVDLRSRSSHTGVEGGGRETFFWHVRFHQMRSRKRFRQLFGSNKRKLF